MTTPNGAPGLIELPGMKGTLQIHYDLAKGAVHVDGSLSHTQAIQILLVAAQGVARELARLEAGIIRTRTEEPKGNEDHGEDEKSTGEENDDDDNG